MKKFLENTWIKRIPLLAAIVIGIISLVTCFSHTSERYSQADTSSGPAIVFAACVYALVEIRKNRWW